MNTGAPHLGIDLGTLRIAATVVRDGLARPVELGANGAASAALAIVGDQVVTGDAAEQVLAEHPDHGVRELQRRFGDTTPVVLDGRPFTADALAAEQMRAVAGAAGVDPGACHLTLTHPASWHDYKTDLLARTANLCGFAEVELVAAPVAVATGYLAAGHLHTGDTVAVFDLGGTLETSVVRIGEDGAAVMGTPQLLERFGGDVIDQMVFRHVTAALGGALEAMDRNDPAVRSAVMRLRAECSAAKERLSTDSEASVKVQAPGLDTEVRITRDEFEAALRPPMAEALNALERAMASAGVAAADLAGVLLVGGGARIPVVGEMVAGHLGRRAIADLDPSMAVALGATAGAVLLAATAAAAEAAAGSAPDSAAGNAADAPSATNEQETTMSDKPNSESTPAGAAPGAPGNIPAPPPPPAKKGVGGKAAGVAAGVAAAAAAVAGAVVYGEDVVDALMGDDGTDDAAAAEALTADQAERVAEADDASMDAFDEVAPQGAATGVPLDAPSGAPAGGGQSAAPSAPQAESAGGFGRSAAPAAESPAESPAEPSVESEPPAPPAAPPAAESVPPAPAADSAFEDARATLLAALDDFEAPAGATPEQVEELKQNLREAIERFDQEPGQSAEDALAELRDEYDSIVTDFVQDQKIDALVQAQQDEEAEDAEGAEGDATDEALPDDVLPGENEPGLEIPGDAEPGLDLPDLDLPGLDLPGLDLADVEIKPIPMPVVDPDDLGIAPETPAQGGVDGPFLNPDLIDLIDGPAVAEPGLQIDPDVLAGGLLGGGGLDIGPKQDDPATPNPDGDGDGGGLFGGGGLLGGVQDAMNDIADQLSPALDIGPKQDDPATPNPDGEGDGGGLFGGLSDTFDDLVADVVGQDGGHGQGGGGQDGGGQAGGPGQGGGGKGMFDSFADTVGDLVGDQVDMGVGPGQGVGGGAGQGGKGMFDSLADTLGDLVGDQVGQGGGGGDGQTPFGGKDPNSARAVHLTTDGDGQTPFGGKDPKGGVEGVALVVGDMVPEADDAAGDLLGGIISPSDLGAGDLVSAVFDFDQGDALPDLGNVASDLADEISPNLPTNLDFGVDGI